MNWPAKGACGQGGAFEKTSACDVFHEVLCLWTLRSGILFNAVFFKALCNLCGLRVAFVQIDPVTERDTLASVDGHIASAFLGFLEIMKPEWIGGE